MVVRFEKEALLHNQSIKDLGVESDKGTTKVSEVDKLVGEAKAKIADGSTPAVGVSPSNSGRGHDPIPVGEEEFVPTSLDGAVLEEEPASISDSDEGDVDSKEVTSPSTEALPQKQEENRKKEG